MKALYVGSFDPFTLGHLSIVQKAREKYDELVICVGQNEAKTPMFTPQQRVKFIRQACFLNKVSNIKVISSNDLTVDIALKEKADVLIRGIRADSADLNSEKQMAVTNRLLAATRGFELNTDFIFQNDPFLQIVSSSLVRSLFQMKEYITMARFLPQCISEEIIAQELKPLFYSLFKESPVAKHYWEMVKEAYTARPYHNMIHLAYMFNQLSIYEQHCEDCSDYITFNANLDLAIFLHDYVYSIQQREICPPHNERDSSDTVKSWYQREIFIPSINPLMVEQLIMATIHPQNGNLSDEQKLIADLDLSILGTADTAAYEAYAKAIRKEYAAFSDEEYKKGRLHFLFSLLKQKPLFHTEFFKERFEQQARENIAMEIKYLHGKYA